MELRNRALDWALFYDHEKRLYDFLQDQNLLTFEDGHKPEYIVKRPGGRLFKSTATVEGPPQYVRCVIAFNDPGEKPTFDRLNDSMLSAYDIAAKNSKASRLPDRFPQYFEDVERINISVSDANYSRRLAHNQSSLLNTYNSSEAVHDDHQQLKNIGIACRIMQSGRTCYELYLENNSLFEYLKTDQIQERFNTGHRYRAKIHFNDIDDKPVKPDFVKYGLIVIDKPCPIYRTQPRKRRTDKLLKEKHSIILPGDIETNFYRIGK